VSRRRRPGQSSNGGFEGLFGPEDEGLDMVVMVVLKGAWYCLDKKASRRDLADKQNLRRARGRKIIDKSQKFGLDIFVIQ